MSRLKTVIASLALLVCVPSLRAQLSTVVVVDFERAVVESAEGKKAQDKFNGSLQAKQNEIEKKQKDIEEQQKKLQNGARTLSDVAKADLQKDIDRRTTELQRASEDAQKEMQALRDELLKPIADRATAILNAMASEQGYTLVIDLSNPDSNIVWFNEKNNITAELVKRIDAALAKEPPKPATGSTPATSTPNRPATSAPATGGATRPTPPPAAPKQP
jgi:outer membrane protein